MWNFVSADKANRALSAKTKLHILVQKYNGLENIENPSRALEVTRGSSTDTNLGHNHLFSNSIFSESSWPLIIVNPFPGFPLFSAPICMENTFFIVFRE